MNTKINERLDQLQYAIDEVETRFHLIRHALSDPSTFSQVKEFHSWLKDLCKANEEVYRPVLYHFEDLFFANRVNKQ